MAAIESEGRERLKVIENVVETFTCPNNCNKGITLKYVVDNKHIPYTYMVNCSGCGEIILEETVELLR